MEKAELPLHTRFWVTLWRSLSLSSVTGWMRSPEWHTYIHAKVVCVPPLLSVVALPSTSVWRDWNIHLFIKRILWRELGVSVKKEHRALFEVAKLSQWHSTAVCFSLSALLSTLCQMMKPPLHMQLQALLSCNVCHGI